MINRGINLNETVLLLTAVNHYNELGSYFPQLDSKNEKLQEFIKSYNPKDNYFDSPIARHWNEIELHVVPQMWSNTSCGWGGIGGSAMTVAYNFIIRQSFTNTLFVYWDGKLAYVIDEKEVKDYGSFPSMRDAKAIYKNTQRY